MPIQKVINPPRITS